MDIFEKLNRAFAGWYESWFGDADSDLRPKDVLRKIIRAMEDNCKEGLDNRIYVPNKYVLEICFDTDAEREYLLAFLDREELESALRKYMGQNRYYMRGPLDFTIEELSRGEGWPEKLSVKCRWDVQPMEKQVAPASAEAREDTYDEELTVAAADIYEAGTIAPPWLEIEHVGGETGRFALSKPSNVIGRSRRLNNDLVIDRDGMVSKRHAEIGLGPDGFVIKDLNSTNGVWVNGERVEGCMLHDGDRIRLGVTEIVFRRSAAQPEAPPASPPTRGRPRLVMRGRGDSPDEFLLASEVVIGRALTNDVRLLDPTVSKRHARVYLHDGEFYVEDLESHVGTKVNRAPVLPGSPVRLGAGDVIELGEVDLRFELD